MSENSKERNYLNYSCKTLGSIDVAKFFHILPPELKKTSVKLTLIWVAF